MISNRLHFGAGLIALAASLLLVPPLTAQETPVLIDRDTDCESGWGDHDRYCETREYSLEPRGRFEIDATPNGSIDVAGWDRPEVRLIARIRANSRDDHAEAIARDIEVRTGSVIEATGPRMGRGQSWSVSYELSVPRDTDLQLRSTNGGIDLSGLASDVAVRTTNGGIRVSGAAGHVRGETTNGGLHVELTGREWDGDGVELRTTNGGVELVVPESYSAKLETGTTNGGIRVDFPIMVEGRIRRSLQTTLGDGGALIRAVTTNGGVVIRR